MDKLFRTISIVFFASIIGSFFTIGTSVFILIRYILPIVIIALSLILKVNFVTNRGQRVFAITYMSIFFLYPMLLIFLNAYANAKGNIIINSLYYIVTIICCFFIASYYRENDARAFFSDFGITGFIFLLVGLVIFKDVSLSIPTLIRNMTANMRVDRTYLGFNNPNQTAILAVTIILCILLSNINIRWKSIIIALSGIVLLNTGSRTPIIALLTALILTSIINFVATKSKSLFRFSMKVMLFDSLMLILLMALIYLLSQPTLNVYYALDTLSTNRISRQVSTLTWLKNSNVLTFGVGMFNTSFFNSQANFMLLHTDSYYTFITVTMGIVGLLANLFLIFLMILHAFTIKSKKLLYIVLFCSIYSFFEATLFFPTSILTIFLLISLFLFQGEEETN